MKKTLLSFLRLRILMLVALTCAAFNGAWAEDVNIGTGTFNGKNSTYTDGWSTTGTGKGRTDCIIIGKDENITSPKFDLTGYSEITISIKARRYGTLSDSKATIDVSIGGKSQGKVDAKGTNATTSLTAITFTPTSDMASAALVFTCTNATSAGSTHGAGINTITITGTPKEAAASDNDLALTGAPIALNFDLYNNHTAQTIHYTTSSTGEVSVESGQYDVSCYVDNENKTITVSPIAVTNGQQTVTVNQAADGSYKAGSVTFTVTVTDSTPIPTHTATFSVNNVPAIQEFEEGETIIFPSISEDIYGKKFVGWATEAIDGTTNKAPVFVTSATMGTSDVTYYAVFAAVTPGTIVNKTDSLTTSTFGSPSSYSNWSGKIATNGSSAVYAGNSTTNNSNIQIRYNTTTPSGIITTTSGGKAKKITVTWASNTAEGRTLNVYGRNTAYTKVDSLYGTNNQKGTLIGTIVKGTSTELSITGDYAFIGMRSDDGAMYIEKIIIDWQGGIPDTYSDYCTTVVADTRADSELAFSASEANVSVGDQDPELPTLSTAEGFNGTVVYTSSNEEVAQVMNEETGELNIVGEGTTTITATFDGNDDFKAGSASYTLTVADNRIVTTITQENITLYLTEVSTLTQLTPVVKDANDNNIEYTNDPNGEGLPEVYFEIVGDDTDGIIGSLDSHGNIVLNSVAGTVTIKAVYNLFQSNVNYRPSECTFTITLVDPNAPGEVNNPYTVAQAIAAFDNTLPTSNVYIRGIVSSFVNTGVASDSYHRYHISDDGTKDKELLVFNGKGLNNVAFSSDNDLKKGDKVVIYGQLYLYNTTKEVNAGNYIVSLVRKPAAPVFSVEEGTYSAAQSVELSCETVGAAIYYTIDGTTPTSESTLYTEAIAVTATTTIKAIAVKDDVASEVASATYTINLEPTIEISSTTVNAPAAGADGTITVTYNNITEVIADVYFCDVNGESATYDWFTAEINEQTNNVDYIIGENTSTEARTAYMKVYAIDDESNDVYSELITITQAGMVIDWATLPFSWDDKKTPTGVTNVGVATYNSSPYLKFDTTGDYIILKINEEPATLTFDIKGNSFSDGTFAMQTSVDGKTYTDLQTYNDENLPSSTQSEIYQLDSDVRYIKWIYTEKSSGNVALGNIVVTAPMSVKLNAYGYATFASEFAIDFTNAEAAGYTAWAVSEINGTTVTFSKITESVPAETGVLLMGEESATVSLNRVATSTFADDNLLVGITAPTTIAADDYYGLKGDKFVKVNAGTIPAGKALLPASVIPSTARELTFVFEGDGTTGIRTIDNGQLANDNYYDLQGRKVNNPKAGLYIKNGNKVVIK